MLNGAYLAQKPSFLPIQQRCTFVVFREPLTCPHRSLAVSGAAPGSPPMTAHRFMFATGIENSYPTIQHGSVRIDELEKGGHYKHWETDFALLQDLDIRYLALWTTHPPDLAGSRSLRLGLRGPDIRAFEEPRHRADRGSLPLRRAGLDRQLPEPGLSSTLCRVRARLCAALPVGAALHARERDVCVRHLLGGIRLVERAARERSGLRDSAQAHRQGERARDVRHPRPSPGCD